MLITLTSAVLPALLTPSIQECREELPAPLGLESLGNRLAAAGNLVVAGDSSQAQGVHIWRRASDGSFSLEFSLPVQGSLANLSTDGESIALASTTAGVVTVTVWRQAAGLWSADPVLLPPSGPDLFGDTLAIENGRLVIRAQSPRLWQYDLDAASGTWDHVQTLLPTAGPQAGFGEELDLAGGLLATSTGSFSARGVEFWAADASGLLQRESELPSVTNAGDFDLHGNRILVVQGDAAIVWRQTGQGAWILEQELRSDSGPSPQAVALGSRWAALSCAGADVESTPVRVFQRRQESAVWLQRNALAPEGGLQDAASQFGRAFAIVGNDLVASEPGWGAVPFGAEGPGRVVAFDLGCVVPPPAVHWLDGTLIAPGAPDFPADWSVATVSVASSLNVGPPMGLRNPTARLIANYGLSFVALPCSPTYGTLLCGFFGYGLRDGATGETAGLWPIAGLGPAPQFAEFQNGPNIPASGQQATMSANFQVNEQGPFDFSIEPTGEPLQLELAANSYNCYDATGEWFTADPDVIPLSTCGYEVFSTTVTSLTVNFRVDASLAFDLPVASGTDAEGYCTALANTTGAAARLMAEGTTEVAENSLYLTVVDLPPGQPGYVMISNAAAQAPFAALGEGQQCLAAPMLRLNTAPLMSNSFGHVAERMDLTQLPSGVQIQAGSTWYLQYVFRDIVGMATTNGSNGLALHFR